jgi:hypothetical protein
MRKASIAAGVILLILVVTSIRSVAEENLIYACLDENGKVNIVNDPGDCKEKETAIFWNKVGLQGPPGEPGPAGTACWDLDTDGDCDLPDEDKSGDGKCDVVDCQGETGIGAIKVCDSSDPPQNLGVLIDVTGEYVVVFVPELKKFAYIILRSLQYAGELQHFIYYETDDCSGTAYNDTADMIVRSYTGRYLVSSQSPRDILAQSYSVVSVDSGPFCQDDVPQVWHKRAFETVEILEEEIPFIPITLPLKYECQSE